MPAPSAHLICLAARSLWRELRTGELRILLLALTVGVAAFAGVGLFTDRVRQAMDRQAGEMLAADRVVESSRPIPSDWAEQARGLGLTTGEAVEFRSMLVAEGRLQLAEVKAVGGGYPLRGALQVAPGPTAAGLPRTQPPEPGTVLVERRLLMQLRLAVGDEVKVGETRLRVAGVLLEEPDRGGSLFQIAPRALMNLADLAATRLIQPGSRSEQRLLVAGPDPALAAWGDWIKGRLRPVDRLLGGRDSRAEITSALERSDRFLGLAALVSLLLAAMAIAMAAHRHALRHRDTSALLRCLGASRAQVAGVYVTQLLLLGLIGTSLGVAVGWAAQLGLTQLLAGLMDRTLPPPSLGPALRAVLAGLVTLAGFALPPLLALRNTPPLRVLRRDAPGGRIGRTAAYGPALLALVGLLAWQAGDATLTIIVTGGAAATIAALALGAWGLVWLVRALPSPPGAAWRLGLANIPRRAAVSVVQIVSFGLGVMVLLLLTLVRGDLVTAWEASLPADAPNHFLINIQPDQIEPLTAFFRQQGIAPPAFSPMLRGRLRFINGQEVDPDRYEEPRAQRLARREFNLSWMEQAPAHNHITAGAWWGSGPQTPQWSVEAGLAETLGIRLGDRLSYDIGGQMVEGEVTSLRRVEWDSFQVNFFVIAPTGALDATQATYITAFHLPEAAIDLPIHLLEAFPNLTDIDVGAVLGQVRRIVERVTLALEFVSLFTLAAGLLVLYAAIQASLDQRLQEGALLRTLGALKGQVRRALATEFLVLGLLASLLAAGAAATIGAVAAGQLFDLPYSGNPWLWLGGVLAGALLLGAAGLHGARGVLSEPPMNSLRRYGE